MEKIAHLVAKDLTSREMFPWSGNTDCGLVKDSRLWVHTKGIALVEWFLKIGEWLGHSDLAQVLTIYSRVPTVG